MQALHTLDFPVEQPRRVYLRAVEQAVLVSREVFPDEDQSAGVLYLLSSDTDLNQATRRPIYPRRWKVEEYQQSLKQNASMGNSPAKNFSTPANHFFAARLAYTKLEALKLRHCPDHFRLKAQLYAAGLKARYQQLQRISA